METIGFVVSIKQFLNIAFLKAIFWQLWPTYATNQNNMNNFSSGSPNGHFCKGSSLLFGQAYLTGWQTSIRLSKDHSCKPGQNSVSVFRRGVTVKMLTDNPRWTTA